MKSKTYIPKVLFAFCFHAILLVFPTFSLADIYYYEDEQGVLRFSDEPPQVSEFHIRQEHPENHFQTAAKAYSRDELRKLILKFSEQYKVDPSLVEAVVKAESAYDVMAISHKGAQGLMQLMPATAESLGVSNAHDPKENLEGGVQYLRKLLDHYQGNVDLALAAYNAGIGAVEKHQGIPPYPETIDYVAKVRKYYSRFAELSTDPVSGNATELSILNP